MILGSFEEEYLVLPQEVLVTVMRDHQKYFAVEDTEGKLLPHFLAVLNTEGDPQGIIRHGHERVLRAALTMPVSSGRRTRNIHCRSARSG